MNDPVTANNLPAIVPSADSSLDSTTPKPKRRGPGKPFVPGDSRINTRGRPKKGESFAEKYMKRLDADADALIEAHVKRAKGQNVVAERAFATALAYKVGLPKQTFVHENGDDPFMQLMVNIQQIVGADPGQAADG